MYWSSCSFEQVCIFKGKLMFKKTLAAVAVGMVVFGAQAAEFTAADGTVFQVNFEALAETVDTVSTAGATTTTFKGDGQIQLKATKKVNDDLNVFGQVEVDFDPVVDNAAAASDDMKIGVASKLYGTVTLGQFDTYMEDNIAEALGYWVHAKADAGVVEPTVNNDGRQIEYKHKFGDFVGALTFNQSNEGSATGAQSNGNAWVLGYAANGLKLFVGQSNIPKFKSDTFAANSVKGSTGASIYYTFGDTTVSAMAIRNETSWTTTKYTDYSGLGVSHVMGPWDFGLAYQAVNTDSNLDTGTNASQWALGVGYTIVKGTTAYFDMNSLGAAKGAANTVVVGFKTAF